jgi:NAD(P)-dependent dehydrogenase (short-subunit alcohol dehydrogenase family)
MLDVSEERSIASARAEVEQASGGRLARLVNSAGIAISAPLESDRSTASAGSSR